MFKTPQLNVLPLPSRNAGLTLVEVLIYIFLLSFLMTGFIQFALVTHLKDVELLHEIHKN